MISITDLIRSGVVCGTCADEGVRSCNCYDNLEPEPEVTQADVRANGFTVAIVEADNVSEVRRAASIAYALDTDARLHSADGSSISVLEVLSAEDTAAIDNARVYGSDWSQS